MIVYTIDGVYAPSGGDRITSASEISLPSVTYPTFGTIVDEPSGLNGDPHVWHRFTAPADGDLILDASLTVVGGGASNTFISVYQSDVGPSPSGIADCSSVLFGANQILLTVEAGVTYFIGLWNNAALGSLFVLRTSGYGDLTAWTQPDDQSWNNGNMWVEPNPPEHTLETITWPTDVYGFHGHYYLIQGLLGDEPTTDPDAALCAWSKAIGGNYGFRFWTDDGTGEGSAPGACVTPVVQLDPTDTGGIVGATYSGSPGGIGFGAESHYGVWSAVSRFWVTHAVKALGPTGGLATPVGPSGSTVIYEAQEPELLGLDAAPDEGTHDDTDIVVDWYGSDVYYIEGALDTWGPYSNGTVARFESDLPTAIEGANGFIGGQPYQLPTFPVDGGDVGWTSVPSDVLESAIAFENNWQALYDSLAPDELSTISAYAGGLRWVGIFPEQLGTTPPDGAYPDFSAPESKSDIRSDQVVVVRMHVRPPRYRFQLEPTLPSVESFDVESTITGASGPQRTRFVTKHRS